MNQKMDQLIGAESDQIFGIGQQHKQYNFWMIEIKDPWGAINSTVTGVEVITFEGNYTKAK
jgi:hypothetical protein